MPIVRLRKQEWEVPAGITVRDAMLKTGQDPQAVLALLDDKLVNEETILKTGDRLRLVAVISGGSIATS